MNKLTTTLLAVLMTATLALFLTACGGTPATSYTVTAEKWAEIMESVTNYTVNISVNDEVIETDKLDDWKVIFIAPENEAYDIMLTKEGDKYYQYEKQNGSWTKEECDGNDEDINIHDYRKLFASFKSTFPSFTYSEDEKQYSCSSLDISATCKLLPEQIANVKVKFENNAITSFIFEVDMDGSTAVYKYGDFGTTHVDLPQL